MTTRALSIAAAYLREAHTAGVAGAKGYDPAQKAIEMLAAAPVAPAGSDGEVELVARAICKGCNLDPDGISEKAAKSGHSIPEWMFFVPAAKNAIEALAARAQPPAGRCAIVPLDRAPYPIETLEDINGYATGGSTRCLAALQAEGITIAHPTEPAAPQPEGVETREPVQCAHEAYQGICAHCYAPMRDGFAVVRRAAPPVGGVRERVARIIDPKAFDHPDVHPQHLAKRRRAAFNKTDAILSALGGAGALPANEGIAE